MADLLSQICSLTINNDFQSHAADCGSSRSQQKDAKKKCMTTLRQIQMNTSGRDYYCY